MLNSKQSKPILYLLSFLAPLVILTGVLLTQNISWGSDATILASDGFHQYVIFNQTLRNSLHGSGSIFYTFTSGLGLNFYALMSYYLGSFLSPLVYFFDLKTMPDALYLFTLIKVGLIGLSTYFTLSKLHDKVNQWLLFFLSTSYALMSFSISQLEINMWLDVFILIPLIILGVYRLLNERKFWLYYLSLTALFIQNYYFGFMTAIFLTLYFLVQLTRASQWKIVGRRCLDFTVVSILSGLSSAVMLLPTYLDLSTHGEKLTKVTTWLTEDTWYLDVFAKNVVGSYDTTKFGAIPMIYVGLLPLILALLFFTIKNIPKRVRLAYALLIAMIIASFYLAPLDLFWQGMHAPNMFLHRYAWVFSTLVILLAAEALEYLSEVSLKQVILAFSPLVLGFVATVIFKSHYDFIQTSQLIITFAFLLAYVILLASLSKNQLTNRFFISFTLLFTLLEISLNTYYQVTALGNEWVFPSRDGYERNLTDIDNLVKQTKTNNTTFYRMERWRNQTGNDSMKYNYNGISQFSSIRNTASSSTLDRLGFKSTGTNLNLRYQNNTLLMDSLFAVKYNLTETNLNKYGFQYLKTSGDTSLYENQKASQLAILTNGIYKDVNFTVNTLDNQTNFINQITGLSESYFTRLNAQWTRGGSQLNNRITINSTNKNQVKTSVSYHLTATEDSQIYVSVPNISFGNDNTKNVQITVNGLTTEYTTDNAYTFFDLGYFTTGQDLEVTFTFLENNQVSFDNPNFYALNLASYQRALNIINSKAITVKAKGNQVIAHYQTDKDASLLFTIPYDKGWTATQDGRIVKINKAQKGFMKVNVPFGKGTVKLTFIPNGLKAGALLSFLGFLLFNLYAWLTYKIKHKQ